MSDMRELLVNTSPLQLSGQDEVLREYTFGGPQCGRDVRFYLDADTLGLLLDIARCSNTRRVILPKAGIKVRVRKSRDGHIYESLHITSGQPFAEVVSQNINVEISPQERDLIDGFGVKR